MIVIFNKLFFFNLKQWWLSIGCMMNLINNIAWCLTRWSRFLVGLFLHSPRGEVGHIYIVPPLKDNLRYVMWAFENNAEFAFFFFFIMLTISFLSCHATGLFLYPLKKLKSRFSDVFRGYRKRSGFAFYVSLNACLFISSIMA